MMSDGALEDLSDAELVALAERRESRRDALGAIYDRYERRVLRFCAGELREKDHALDAAHDAFASLTAHFVGGGHLQNPAALGAYLRTIAHRACMTYMRGGTPGKGHKSVLDPLALGDVPDAPAADSALLDAEDDLGLERLRRLLDEQVVPSLHPRHQVIYDHTVRRRLTGEALAEALGMSADRAKNNAHHVRTTVVRAFAAFALYAAGRGACAELDALVRAAIERDGEVFTRRLREDIHRHFDTCPECGNCRTCRPLQTTLVARYAPVLLPLVFAGELRDRFQDTLREVGDSTPLPSTPPPGVPRSPRSPEDGTAESGEENAARSLGRRLRVPVAMGLPLVLLLGFALYQHRPSGDSDTPVARSTPSAPPTTVAARPVPPRTVLSRFFVGNNSLAFSPDGAQLATLVSPEQNGSDYSVQLWNASTGTPGATFATTGRGVSAVGFSPDGRTVASGAGSSGGSLVFTLRDSATGQVADTITTLTGTNGVSEGSSIVYSSDGRLLAMSAAGASATTQDTVEVWDTTTHAARASRSFAGESVYQVAFSPDGRVLAVGGGDGVDSKGVGRVDLLDPATAKTTATLRTTGNLVYSLAYSPDGTTLATASQTVDNSAPTPGSVQLWDTRTHEASPLTGTARALAFSSRGVLAVARGSEVELWNVSTKTITATLTMDRPGQPASDQAITDVVFSPDGATLAAESGSTTRLGDEHVSLWDVP
ncbi:hypothetical protein [Streptomyces hundungensis]|uniref:hypothetical protein n=1 Tax=Streptomyces hundungensis TaxID=1077946 RepID=UPI0033DB3E61